jgi:hypothetical protein
LAVLHNDDELFLSLEKFFIGDERGSDGGVDFFVDFLENGDLGGWMSTYPYANLSYSSEIPSRKIFFAT